jgi:hypothetical protein
MNDPMMQESPGGAAGGDVLGKIEALKAQIEGITVALDDIAASVGGGEPPAPVADEAMPEVPEAPEAPEGSGPGPSFKKKPKGDMLKGLGI